MRSTVDPAIDSDASLQRVIQQVPQVRKDLDALLSDGAVPRSAIAVAVRNLLHSTPSIQRLPAVLHNREQLNQLMVQSRRAISRELSLGMYLSVTCAEDVWRVTDAEARRETQGTLLGDYWHRELRAACEEWPHAKPARGLARPLKSSIPTLLISGAYDPVTPPREAAMAARTLSNSRHIVVTNGSHSFAGMPGCVDKIMSAFVIHPDPRGVDASCVDRIPPLKFEQANQ
jgi:pimeloyl-ACP methyl ester carboxylesterase